MAIGERIHFSCSCVVWRKNILVLLPAFPKEVLASAWLNMKQALINQRQA